MAILTLFRASVPPPGALFGWPGPVTIRNALLLLGAGYSTELPRAFILGNWASGVRNSRKLNSYHYSFSETLYVGVVLYLADRGCMHELPVYGVLGNWASD